MGSPWICTLDRVWLAAPSWKFWAIFFSRLGDHPEVIPELGPAVAGVAAVAAAAEGGPVMGPIFDSLRTNGFGFENSSSSTLGLGSANR